MAAEISEQLKASIAEAQLDAAISEVTDGHASGEKVVAAVQHEEASTETFVADRRNADAVTVYSQMDGTSSDVLVSMLSKQLRKRFPRDPNIPERLWGRLAFKMDPPANTPMRPKLTCWLHPDHEKRDGLQVIGLGHRVCRKSNIPSEMDVLMHVQKKHPQEYRIIEASKAEVERAEDRTHARNTADAIQVLAARAFEMEMQPNTEPEPAPEQEPDTPAEEDK
jgi:hypothetical protein